MKVIELGSSDYPQIVEVWEASVRATHGFLEEDYLLEIKGRLASEYLPAVRLFGVGDGRGRLLAFAGVAEAKIEMLFARPDAFGLGLGKALLLHAVKVLGARRVDVNEENAAAREFYAHFGFRQTSRDALDAAGRSHPILHLELKLPD